MAFGLGYGVRRQFFDRDAVLRRADRATLKALRTAGGRTRLVARRSIRKRKKTSEPGSPPSSHTGRLKDGIWFASSAAGKGVVVGPVRYNQTDLRGGKWMAGTVPQVLEQGGRIGVLEQQILAGGDWHRVDHRRRKNNNAKRVRVVSVAARPFMAPALEKVRPTLATLWKDSIR